MGWFSSGKWFVYVALLWHIVQVLRVSAFESYLFYDFKEDGSHRNRRDVFASYTPPQPTAEFPVILFSDLNYNNDTVNGYYHRLGHGEFRVFGRTVDNRVRQFVFRSMLFLPYTNVTFRGIYYTSWEHWQMEFSLQADACQSNCQPLPCSGVCYFGTCGIDGTCQCANGYSGSQCETRPAVGTPYPTEQYPLLLFPQKNFQGTPLKVEPNKYAVFAENKQKKKNINYNSLRVLFSRKLTFSQLDNSLTQEIATGSDIEDIPGFMENNPHLVADDIWFNYASDIELQFGVKVEELPSCTNCSATGGCCFTGTCQCLPNFTGVNCETPV
ncbi:uncharacterized protein LOC5506577 isoform X2 [Nematostella vectensis]|uniref:uncharacterized protein LOC5506577 isoform X2 n=1 Tax=Nematostella vectensis TaxID=45351 RepID=UPI002076F85E|nr:uncharacterized protein LOC5506577 isoform X2 [Nematostella vectensis]